MNDAAPFDAADVPRALATPIAGVSLWWCGLSAPEARQAAFESWLSDAEHARMRRFGTAALRARYLIGRGTLRWLLAEALACAPRDVVIARGPRGRPYVVDSPSLDFNVSHTGDRAMIGLARNARIGVDIERGDRPVNVDGIARKFMTAGERAAFPDSGDGARRRLLRLWTCKEALSKATGDALSAPFSRIEIDVAPTMRLASGPAPYTPDDWSLYSIDAPDDHLTTVALWRRAPARV
jgi:4'-phosphopantetheinyl transferase